MTQEKALKIANENGYTNDNNEIRLMISSRKTGKIDSHEAIKKNLAWRLYYDEEN